MRSLKTYEEKRPARTVEPPPVVCCPQQGLIREYSIQEHLAKKAGWHEDFRFADEGVALSFVFPKGMQFSGKESRLAVETEDHPVAYMSWEGEIPDGYGAGTLKLVEHGSLEILDRSKDKMRLRILDGSRRGTYQWVRSAKSPRQWFVRRVED